MWFGRGEWSRKWVGFGRGKAALWTRFPEGAVRVKEGIGGGERIGEGWFRGVEAIVDQLSSFAYLLIAKLVAKLALKDLKVTCGFRSKVSVSGKVDEGVARVGGQWHVPRNITKGTLPEVQKLSLVL